MKIIIELDETQFTDEHLFREKLCALCLECGYEVIEYDEEFYKLPDRIAAEIEKFVDGRF